MMFKNDVKSLMRVISANLSCSVTSGIALVKFRSSLRESWKGSRTAILIHEELNDVDDA